jgi:protein PhnA
MTEIPPCPKCKSPYAYESGHLYNCPECGHEWNNIVVNTADEKIIEDVLIVKDSNGAVLQNGDDVIVIKDLPVKGFLKSIKSGTKVKNIRLTEGDHNIDCKVEGYGAMALKSIYVKKA